jgi:hypothetical protein
LTIAERTADGRYELSYLHLSETSVGRGEKLAAGERVGAVGVSGTRSAGQPHLHFGVREADDRHAYLDPLRFLAPPPSDAPSPRPAPVPVAEPVAALPAVVPVGGAPASAPPVRAGHPVATPQPQVLHGVHALTEAVHRQALQASPVHHSRTDARLGPSPTVHHPAGEHSPASSNSTPGHGPAASGVAVPTAAPSAASHPASRGRRGGINLGWLAACIGLVAAAALLAGPGAGGRKGRWFGGAAFTALFRAASRG